MAPAPGHPVVLDRGGVLERQAAAASAATAEADERLVLDLGADRGDRHRERRGRRLAQLAGHCTYDLTVANNTDNDNAQGSSNGLPIIETAISIDGHGSAIAVTGTDFRIFEVLGGDLSLRNITLTGGNVAEFGGGAIVNLGGNLEVDHATVWGNTASGGGGIASAGSATIDHSTITKNTSVEAGAGGVLNHGGSMTIDHSNITWNTAGGGGGIVSGPGDPEAGASFTTVSHSKIDHNTANGGQDGGGGGIANGGTFELDHSEVANNSAPGGAGAGILNHGVQLTLDHVHVTKNPAANDGTTDGFGGGIANLNFGLHVTPSVTLTASHSDIDHNFASGGGGGIFNADVSGTNAGIPTVTLDHHTHVHDNEIHNCEQMPSGTIAGCTG